MASSSTKLDIWANLHPEMVLSIAKRLVITDVIRIRAVCGNWAWSLGKKFSKRPLPPPQPSGNLLFFQCSPWLLLRDSASLENGVCKFLSYKENRRYKIPSLPQITNRLLLESSHHGWLVTIDRDQFIPSFLNLFTQQELILPSMLTIPRNDWPFNHLEGGNTHADFLKEVINLLVKIIFTPSPQQEGIAVAIWDGASNGITLPFASVGDEAWSSGPYLPLGSNFLEDVVYNEKDGTLYALSSSLDVFILKFMNHSLEIVSMVARPMDELQMHVVNKYLVVSHGVIMQVNWYRKCRHDYSSKFKIFKFNSDFHNLPEPQIHACSPASCWVPVNDLGNQCLFLGIDIALCVNWGDNKRKNKVIYINNMVRKFGHLYFCVFDIGKDCEDNFVLFNNVVEGKPLPTLFMPAPKLWD